MPAINRRSDRPVYKQVADDLRRRITEGEFAAGGPLPSEPTLSAQYDGVSRTIVRQGLSILRSEGLILSRHGKGWFVREHRPVRRMAWTRYQAELNQVGKADQERDASPFYYDHSDFERFDLERTLTTVPADEDLSEVFQIPLGTMLLCREFTFIFDGRPHRRSRSYLLLDMVEGTPIMEPENEPWPGGTMAQMDSVGIRVTAVEEIVHSRMPIPDEVDVLDIEEGVPVLTVRRIMFAGEKPVEACVDIVIPADRVVLHYRMELTDPTRS